MKILNTFTLIITTLLLCVSFLAVADDPPLMIPAPPALAATSYILIDAKTGRVIVEQNSDAPLPPASLTKMMTAYIVADELAKGKIHLDDDVLISKAAWDKGGSKMFIKVGDKVKLDFLLKGVIIQSGNDASIALAEHIAGAEDAFADVMNQQARYLGMENSQFKNATGWPADGHYSTARDLAILAQAIIQQHPEHYKIYSEKYFEYNNIRQPNRNRLLWRDSSVDGVKTGHTQEAGYCLVASAVNNGMRLISVVMGTKSEEARAVESQKLLSYGFRYYETHRLYGAEDVLSENRVWGGVSKTVGLGLGREVFLTIPRGSEKNLKAEMTVDQVIRAPFESGHEFGKVIIANNDEVIFDESLVALERVDEAGIFSRLWDMLVLFIYQLLNIV